MHLYEVRGGGLWALLALSASSVEPEVTVGHPKGPLRRELGMDKNKDRQTLQRQTGTSISLSLTLAWMAKQLLLCARELHLRPAQDSEKLVVEIWQELEDLQAGCCLRLTSQASRSVTMFTSCHST